MKFIFAFVTVLSILCSCSHKTVADDSATSETQPTASSEKAVPSDDSFPIDKGTTISFIENVTFKNSKKQDMEIRLASHNDKNCAISTMMKKNSSYTIEPGQKLNFVSSKKATSSMKHHYRIYSFSGPGDRIVNLACTDRMDLNFEEVRDAWDFRGESTVVISKGK